MLGCWGVFGVWLGVSRVCLLPRNDLMAARDAKKSKGSGLMTSAGSAGSNSTTGNRSSTGLEMKTVRVKSETFFAFCVTLFEVCSDNRKPYLSTQHS